MSTSSYKVLEEPIQSITDHRHYRVIRLSNELTALLISDPETDKASACMDVKVGHLWNPPKIDGLAHFLEHMLFLGNEKYPGENEYQTFVQVHGGMTNAYTTSEHTNYFFDVSYQFLESTLDRFAQFFISPTFTESATQREMQAVESEYRNGQNQDSYRLGYFNQIIVNPEHPFYRFAVGSLQSLRDIPLAAGIDVREELLKFHKNYYSANIMKLVVLGRESLDELQSKVCEIFSPIKNTSTLPRFPGFGKIPLFLPHQLPSLYHIVPNTDAHNLRIYWPIKSNQEHYEEKPDRYIGHLLGHEAEGSLFALLKKNGWALQLIAGTSTRLSDFEFFSCVIALSKEGIEHVNEIISLIFQYLRLLKKSGIQEWIFSEMQKTSEMEFRFIEKQKPASYTSFLASQMQYLPEKYYLNGLHLFAKYDPDLIKNVLDQMTPENMIVQVISKKFEGKTSLVDKWYEIKYSKEKLPESLIQELKNDQSIHPELQLPKQNEFLPTDFSVIEGNKDQKYPKIILDDPIVTVWHKQDYTFLKPKAHIVFQIITPEAYQSPHSVVLTTLFTKLCQDSLNEKYTYYADIAGLSFELQCIYEGILIEVAGYNEKIPLLLEKIIERLSKFKVKEERFAVIKEQQIRNYQNVKGEHPYERGQFLVREIMSQKIWTPEQKLVAIKELTSQDLRNFISVVFQRVKMRFLAQGNITEDQIVKLVNSIQTILKPKPIFPPQFPEKRVVQLKKGIHYIHQSKIEALENKNSAIWNLYQIGSQEIRNDVLLELLCQVIQASFYENIRTKQQLGYYVWTLNMYDSCVGNFCAIVQSPNKFPPELDDRIEEFLRQFKDILTQFSDQEWEKHVDALRSLKLQKQTMLGHEIKLNWNEISKNTFQFDRREDFVKELQNITREDLIQFFEEKIINSTSRRKLSVYVYGGFYELPEIKKEGNIEVIEQRKEQEFKNLLPLHPSKVFIPKL